MRTAKDEFTSNIDVFMDQTSEDEAVAFISRIQSDAHRAGFSAGLEAGAKLAEEGGKFYRSVTGRTYLDEASNGAAAHVLEKLTTSIRALLAEATTTTERT